MPRTVDFSDIPELKPEQLGGMRRVGRPPLGHSPRRLVSIRLDEGVLEYFRRQAAERGVGYQTLISEVLAQHSKGVS